MIDEQKLFGLMAVADEHQVAVSDALHELHSLKQELIETVKKETRDAIDEAMSPALKELKHSEEKLKSSAKWFAWKSFSLATFGIISVCFLSYGLLTYQLHQSMALTTEIEAMEGTLAKLEADGGKVKISECNDRLCIEFDESNVYTNKETGKRYAIPTRY